MNNTFKHQGRRVTLVVTNKLVGIRAAVWPDLVVVQDTGSRAGNIRRARLALDLLTSE